MLEKYSAKTSDSDSVEVEYDFGDNLQDAVEKFGEDVVFSRYKASAVIDLQSFIRGKIRQQMSAEGFSGDLDTDAIQEAVSEWTLGVKAQRSAKSAEEKARDLLARLPAEVRAQLLAEIEGAEGEAA